MMQIERLVCVSFRADEESARRSELEKTKRELDNQLEELKEDLEAEKSARTKAEKQRRELGEVKKTDPYAALCDKLFGFQSVT